MIHNVGVDLIVTLHGTPAQRKTFRRGLLTVIRVGRLFQHIFREDVGVSINIR